jgi:nitroimidazol reductase NimA-like FMN-containing flavoprotein (pyridoxamine 5'-phosphate oxidase superfamily)
MLIRELSAEECLELLRRSRLCRLACASDNQPYIVPIQYFLDADRRCLYCFSTVGQKVTWMRGNPQVCVEVDEITDKDHWSSVVIYGRYEEIDDTPAEAGARRRAKELFEARKEWWLPAAARLRDREPHAMVVYRITLDRMTGRKAARTG